MDLKNLDLSKMSFLDTAKVVDAQFEELCQFVMKLRGVVQPGSQEDFLVRQVDHSAAVMFDTMMETFRKYQKEISKIGCSYCDWLLKEAPKDQEEVFQVLRNHVEKDCPKHPMRELERRLLQASEPIE